MIMAFHLNFDHKKLDNIQVIISDIIKVKRHNKSGINILALIIFGFDQEIKAIIEASLTPIPPGRPKDIKPSK